MAKVNTQLDQKVSESARTAKTKKVSIKVDPKVWEALKDFCIEQYGSCYGHQGNETSNAIAFYLTAVDRQEPFTTLSNRTKLRVDVRMKLKSLLKSLLTRARLYNTTQISQDVVDEVIRNVLGTNNRRTVKCYITLLQQHGMKPRRANNAIVYDVSALAKGVYDDSYFKDINRTKANYELEDAGQHPQDEDQSRPENNRVGLIREKGEEKYKDA